MRRGQTTLRGNYDHRKNKLITPDAIHEEVRVVWRNGKLAVWREDITNWTADRIYLLSDVSFRPRTHSSEPHLLVLDDDTEWQVKPLYAGGCGCEPTPLKGVSRESLLAPDYAFSS